MEVEDGNERLIVNHKKFLKHKKLSFHHVKRNPEWNGVMQTTNDPKRQEILHNLDRIRRLAMDVLPCHLAKGIQNTPMWVGWNSRIVRDTFPQQKICYLPQLKASPISSAAVAETMRIAKRAAGECNQTSISVTYDLALSKHLLFNFKRN